MFTCSLSGSYTQEFCLLWLREGSPSPFDTLRQLTHYCAAVALNERHLPTFVWNDDHTAFDFKGQTMQLDSIAVMYAGLMDEAEALFTELTEGLDTTTPIIYKDIVDYMDQDDPEYSFLGSHNHQVNDLKLAGIQSMLQQSEKWQVPGSGEDERPVWNQKEMKEWMLKAQNLNQMLMVLMHIGGGMPARGTEMMTMLLRNEQNVHRAMFAAPEGMAWIIGYNKVCVLIVICS